MERETYNEILTVANSNVCGEYDLVELCEGLSKIQLINILGWVLKESRGPSLGQQASWLTESLLYQIEKAQNIILVD